MVLYVHKQFMAYCGQGNRVGMRNLWVATSPCAPTHKDRRDCQPPPEQQCWGGGDPTSAKWLVHSSYFCFNNCIEQKLQKRCLKSNCSETTQQQDNPSSYESPPLDFSWAFDIYIYIYIYTVIKGLLYKAIGLCQSTSQCLKYFAYWLLLSTLKIKIKPYPMIKLHFISEMSDKKDYLKNAHENYIHYYSLQKWLWRSRHSRNHNQRSTIFSFIIV